MVTGLTSAGRDEVAVALVLEECALRQIQHLREIRSENSFNLRRANPSTE
jgi:hypothetical protein